jgi:hypothetical protein
MAQHTRNPQTDIRAAVDAISSQFSAKSSHTETKKGISQTKKDISTGAHTATPPTDDDHPLKGYLSFSEKHQSSNHIMFGVIAFFVLIISVWGFLWHQSLSNIDLTESFQFDILSQSTNDISAIFQEIAAEAEAERVRETEITLKTDLATALNKAYSAQGGISTTTMNTITE